MNRWILLLSLVACAYGFCYDSNRHCNYWASEGECEKNNKFMFKNCAASCDSCIVVTDSAPEDTPNNDDQDDTLTATLVHQQQLNQMMQQYNMGLPLWGPEPNQAFYAQAGSFGLYAAQPWQGQVGSPFGYGQYPFGWLYIKKK